MEMEKVLQFKESRNIFQIDKFVQAAEKSVNTWNRRNGIINNMILVRLLLASVAQYKTIHTQRFENPFCYLFYSFVCVPSKWIATTAPANDEKAFNRLNKRNIWYRVYVYAGIQSIQKWPDHQLIASIAVRARGIKPFQFLINCFSVLPHYFVFAVQQHTKSIGMASTSALATLYKISTAIHTN